MGNIILFSLFKFNAYFSGPFKESGGKSNTSIVLARQSQPLVRRIRFITQDSLECDWLPLLQQHQTTKWVIGDRHENSRESKQIEFWERTEEIQADIQVSPAEVWSCRPTSIAPWDSLRVISSLPDSWTWWAEHRPRVREWRPQDHQG